MTDCVDHGTGRVVLRDTTRTLDDTTTLDLVTSVASKYRWMHVEKLEEIDGASADTRARGED